MKPNAQSQAPMATVVTVCRNCIGDLRKTIESVAQQTYPDFEHLIIDGASTDATHEYLLSLTAQSWISEPDKGIYDAMNKGVLLAHGQWIIFMNAGDTFAAPDTLERVFTNGSPDADIVYGDVLKGNPPTVKKAEAPHNGHRMYFCHQSCLARRQTLLDDPFDTAHRFSADFKWVKRAWKRGLKFLQLDFPIAYFDTNGISNRRRSEGLMDNIRIIREEDSPKEQLRLLPGLCFVWAMCKMRGK